MKQLIEKIMQKINWHELVGFITTTLMGLIFSIVFLKSCDAEFEQRQIQNRKFVEQAKQREQNEPMFAPFPKRYEQPNMKQTE